jgi:hypothetical protein
MTQADPMVAGETQMADLTNENFPFLRVWFRISAPKFGRAGLLMVKKQLREPGMKVSHIKT